MKIFYKEWHFWFQEQSTREGRVLKERDAPITFKGGLEIYLRVGYIWHEASENGFESNFLEGISFLGNKYWSKCQRSENSGLQILKWFFQILY